MIGTVNRKGLTEMTDFTRGMVFALAALGLEMYETGDVAHLPLVFAAILVTLVHDALTDTRQ